MILMRDDNPHISWTEFQVTALDQAADLLVCNPLDRAEERPEDGDP